MTEPRPGAYEVPTTGDPVADLRRDYEHTKDVGAVLELLAKRFAEEGVPFAVIGALAARQYGYVRHTEDIDILTTPAGLAAIHARMIGKDLVPRAPGLKRGLREPSHRVKVDVIVAGDHAGSGESPLVYPDPVTGPFVNLGRVRYPTLAALIEFKLASGVWGKRGQDLVDAQKLISANGLAEGMAESIRPELRALYLEQLANARAERRIEDE